MKIYLVGGAVRDQLLGLPVKERDWVVVGASPEELLAQGFQAVGKDFPVFLHPKTHEEYALARTERKTAKGYKGFQFHAAADVSLEEDLKRRDLTINAIAQSKDGELIDPYHGREDLAQKILRHISPAFQEDPVRILRVARFSAKLPDFSIHPDTLIFMQNMVKNGEVDALVAERVWQECNRALGEKSPSCFFTVLENCQCLDILFPNITFNLSTLQTAAKLTDHIQARFASAIYNSAPQAVKKIIKHYRLPRAIASLAELVCKQQQNYQKLDCNNAEALLEFLEKTDALRRPERFADFLICAQAITENKDNEKTSRLNAALTAASEVKSKPFVDQGLAGLEFAKAMHQARITAVKKILNLN